MREGSRSERIHHRERVIKNRRHHWGLDSLTDRMTGKIAGTPTPCSCWMCGNPRKYSGNTKNSRTIQELRHFESEKIKDES